MHQLCHNQAVTDVLKHTRRSIIESALLRNPALPEWMLQGTSLGEDGLEVEYDGNVI